MNLIIKQEFHNNNVNNIYKYNPINLQYLICGLFQAKGHIGIEFDSKTKYTCIPIVYISMNYSPNTLVLFKLINEVFNNKMNLSISLLNSGKYNIRIYSRN